MNLYDESKKNIEKKKGKELGKRVVKKYRYEPGNGKRRTNRRVNDVRSHRVGSLVQKKMNVILDYGHGQ